MASSHSSVSITTENQNFYRLIRLLVTTGTKVLCNILKQRAIVTHTKATFQEILDDPTVKTALKDLHLKKRVINASQWNLLYPATGDSDTSTYDISLLVVLIRNVCGFPKRYKWDSLPASGDKSLQADIARLKYFRNQVCCHSATGSIEDKDFHPYFDETKNAILGICTHLQPHQQVSAADIEKLRTERTTDPSLWQKYVDLGNQWAEDERNIKKQLLAHEGRLKDLQVKAKKLKKDTAKGFKTMNKKMDFLATKVEKGNTAHKIQNEGLSDKQLKDIVDKTRYFYCTNMSEIIVLEENDRVPMDDIHVTLTWSQQISPSTTGEKRELQSYQEMFDIPRPSDKKLPRRILVEGTVGMGKSVFSQKICVDWSKGDCEELNRYEILLHICLAEVEDHGSLQDIIFSQLQVEVSDETKHDMMSYIQENQSKILLVLDGYDEYSDKNQDINNIISRSLLSDCCVIITSRPWKTVDEKSMKHYDLFLELEGFKQESAIREFTEKFMKLKSEVEEPEELTDRFLQQMKNQNLLSFVQAPFLLVISCLLFLENQCHIPERVTEMYEKLMDLMFDRYEQRNKDQDIDRHTIMLSLGKLSYETLVSDRPLLFKKGDIREKYGDVVFDAGFLSQHKYRSRQGQYMVSFPHKSFPEYLAAYYLKHEKEQFDKFVQWHLIDIKSAAKFENVLRFVCGLLQTECRPVLDRLIGRVNSCMEQYYNTNFLSEFISTMSKLTSFFGILLLKCANEGRYTWLNDMYKASFLVLNEETWKLIPLNTKLCVEIILICGLKSSQLSSVYRRLDTTKVGTIILEKQTSLREFHEWIQQKRKGLKRLQINNSKIPFQNLECLKQYPTPKELTLEEIELSENSSTPTVQNTISQTDIRELSILHCSPSVTKYFLEDQHLLKNLIKVTTCGQDMMRLLQSKNLNMIKFIIIDNEKIQEPGNHVIMDKFIKLIAINPTIEKMWIRHSHVVMSSHRSFEHVCSERQIVKAVQNQSDQCPDTVVQSGQGNEAVQNQSDQCPDTVVQSGQGNEAVQNQSDQCPDTVVQSGQGNEAVQNQSDQCPDTVLQSGQGNKDLPSSSVSTIRFDECSFVDEMGNGFQQLEIYDKLSTLTFYLCFLPFALISLLGKTLSKMKYLEILLFRCREGNHYLRYLTDSIEWNSRWDYIKTFSVSDGITSKEDMEAVMRMIKLMQNLTTLKMSNNSPGVISTVHSETIDPFLYHGLPCANIRELFISGLKIGRKMGDVLQTVKPLRNLEVLGIRRNSFDDRDASTLLQFIDSNYKKTVGNNENVFQNLKKIDLINNNFSFESKNDITERNEKPPLQYKLHIIV